MREPGPMKHLRAASVAALLLLAASPATATVMVRASVEALTRESERVVLGTVARAEAVAGGPRGEGGIFTRVELAVEETWRGAPGRAVVLWVHGGRLGDRAMRTHGQATFEVGERVVVFLDDAGGALFPTGMSQGKWVVEGDRVRSAATPDALVDPSGGALRPAAPLAPRSLAALRDAVERVR